MKWIQAPFLLIRLIPLSIILLLTGCSYFQNPSVRLCTDKSVFAAYTEVFNASQDKYRLEICYLEKPIDLLQSKNVVPDLLIGTGLWDPALLEEFEPLNDLFENNHIDERGFYRELLNLGRKEGKQYLFPVNFNLPVIIMEDQRPEDAASNMLIALDTLKQQGVEYNVKQNGLYKKMGFSPLWNDRFLYYTAVLYGAHFQVDAQGQIKWNQKELQDALEFLKAWINETNGGYETERAFTERYMKIPDYRLLAEGRIRFFLSESHTFLQIPQEKRENLDFRWLSLNNRIPVAEDILFVGIPRGAKNIHGAKLFLTWLFQSSTQTKLLEINRFKRLVGIFGIANGFSSLIEVNERVLPQPQYYPIFVGQIPSADLLSFPLPKPKNWEEIKTKIIRPWLLESIVSPNSSSNLSSRLNQ